MNACPSFKGMKSIVVHIVFVTFVLVAGVLTGVSSPLGPWFDGLQKPFFQPPPWVFGPVWTILYILIGIAGARIWMRAPASGGMQAWFAQMVLNFLWSPAFFGLQSPGLGLMVIVPLLGLIVTFIVINRTRDRVSALLFAPYALWTAFATVLNASIVLMN